MSPAALVSYHYCPPCSASFLVVDEGPSGGELAVLQGRSDDPELTNHPQKPYRHLRVAERDLASYRNELAAAVRRFQTARHANKQVRCAQSHSTMDTLSQWGIMMERSLYISGCDTCLTAYVQERDRFYGWELGVIYAYDIAQTAWTLREVHRPSMDPGVLNSCLDLLNRIRAGYDAASRSFTERCWGLV